MNSSNLPSTLQQTNHQLNLHLFQQGDIAFVKLDTDEHEWPVKVAHYFLQRKKDKVFKKDESSESFTPSKKVSKRGRPSNKRQRQYQIVYKVKYYEWPSFAFVLQQEMIPFTTKLQKRLLELNIKKLTRAIDKAKFQMKIQQRIKLQKSLKRQQSNNQQKPQQQRQKNILTPKKSLLKNKQVMNMSLIQNLSKKQKKANKKLNKSLIIKTKSNNNKQNQQHKTTQNHNHKDQHHLLNQNNNSFSTQTNSNINALNKKHKRKQLLKQKQIQPQTKQTNINYEQTQYPKQSSNATTTANSTTLLQNIIKQEYTSDNQNNNNKSRIKQNKTNNNKHNQSCSSYLQDNSQSDQQGVSLQQKHTYFLDGILYKNKYQILGILSDLLEDFLTRIIWIDDLHKEVNQKNKQFKKRINTLNKIIQCQIFTFQQLSRSRSLQKMLNIVKLGEIMNLPHKLTTCPLKSKLIKTYKLIINSLKNLQSSKGRSTLEKSIKSNSKASQTVDNISKTKGKQSKSPVKRRSKNPKQKSIDRSVDKPKRNYNKQKPVTAAIKQNKSISKQKSQKKKIQKSKSQQKKKQDSNLVLDQKCRLNFSSINDLCLK